MKIAIAGAGAFGTALAVSFCAAQPVTIWARNADTVDQINIDRVNPRLPNVTLPDNLTATNNLDDVFAADIILLAIPAQQFRSFVAEHSAKLAGKMVVSCAKGIDTETMRGTASTIQDSVPTATIGLLTGPSFAADIAKGLPTALTLACTDTAAGELMQNALSVGNLRFYRTTDVIGAELGGSLKNVYAIACGACIGEGIGDSARAALMTRGMAETMRLAAALGAKPETLMGLSGFGDLVLTCTSELSRNYRYGLSIGRMDKFTENTTVEGVATTHAVAKLAAEKDIDMPIVSMLQDILTTDCSVAEAIAVLLRRPLKEE